MAAAWGSKAAMVPAAGLQRGSSVRSSIKAPGGAKRAVAGLRKMPLRLLQSKGVASTEMKRSLTIVAAKAEGQAEVADIQVAAEDLLKKAQDSWEKVDDKLAIGGLGFLALIVLWGSTGLISALDKLPVIPQFLELVGLLFTGWFVYRYLLFKPDREELLKVVDDTKSKITGQD